MDTRQICEVYLFEDGGYGTIKSMGDRIYTLLHAKFISGAGRVDWAGNVRPWRDIEVDAWVERHDYLVIAIRAGS